MNLIETIRKNLLYFILSMPIVIILYELFMMMAIGNRGWSMLLIGQITLVPLLVTLLAYIFSAVIESNIIILITVVFLILAPVAIYYGIKE